MTNDPHGFQTLFTDIAALRVIVDEWDRRHRHLGLDGEKRVIEV